MNIAIALLVVLGANTFQETLEMANSAYRAGDFPGAIQHYEHLLGSAVDDPAVYYNLGNAYYRNGQLGFAIANYERALRLNPDMTHASQNLARAVASTKRGLAKPLPPAWEQSLFFWHYRLSYQSARICAIAAWLCFWLLLGLLIWKPNRYLKGGAVVLGMAALALGVSSWVKAQPSNMAVAVAETVPVRFGTSDQEAVRFELFEGDRVLVDQCIDHSGPGGGGSWCRVETVGGERGWVQREQLCLVDASKKNLL